MPRIYQDVQITEQRITAIECSRCKKTATPDDFVEWQEFFTWINTGGFGSVWGDGTKVSVDLCQQCTHDIFSGFATIHDA